MQCTSLLIWGKLKLMITNVTFSHLDTLKNTTVFTTPSGVITKGNSVTLTCSSDANPPVGIYTWFKVGESTPVGSGQQYSITDIRSEDGGLYYCEARNKNGAGKSSTVSVIVEGICVSSCFSNDDLTCDCPPPVLHV